MSDLETMQTEAQEWLLDQYLDQSMRNAHPNDPVNRWLRALAKAALAEPKRAALPGAQNRRTHPFVIGRDALSLFVGDRPEDAQCASNAAIVFHWAKNFFAQETDGNEEIR